MGYTKVKFEEVSNFLEKEEKRSVEIFEGVSDLTFDDFIFKFIKPLLKGIGYGDKLIDERLGGD